MGRAGTNTIGRRLPVIERDGGLWSGDVQVLRWVPDFVSGLPVNGDALVQLGASDLHNPRFHACAICGSRFIANAKAKVCSEPCRVRMQRETLQRIYRTKHPAPDLSDIQCESCGSPIKGAERRSKRTCSDACRQRVHRQRRAGS